MPHLIKQMLSDAADAMQDPFDTHAVIEELQRSHPQEYTRDLYRHVHQYDPITSLHAEIGRRLLSVRSIQKTTKVLGRNLRGRTTFNKQWRRVVSQAPIVITP